LNDLLRDKNINYLYSSEDSKLYIGMEEGIIYVDLETQESKEYLIPERKTFLNLMLDVSIRIDINVYGLVRLWDYLL